MSFERNTSNQPEPKKRSLFRTMFVPDVMGGMSGIGESLQMFVKLIAYLFIINGLFPAEHPAMQPQATRPLSLGEVLSTGWSRLSFKKENIVPIIIYFSVVATLSLTVLFLLTSLFALMSGTAHAADSTSMFTPPDETNDLSHNWLILLFKQGSMTYQITNLDGVVLQTPAAPTMIQQALSTALAYYSTAILVFAGIILMYHLVVMIAETAHSGVPMGRNANQVWAPIRLVFAIGLLVPISGGLNTGQYIAVQVADWGGGLASNVWKMFVSSIDTQSKKVILPPLAPVGDVVRNAILSEACEKIYNQMEQDYAPDSSYQDLVTDDQVTGNTYDFFYGTKADKEFCGGYSIPNPSGLSDPQQAQLINQSISIFKDGVISSSVKSQVDTLVKSFIPGTDEYDKVTISSNQLFRTAITDYRQRMSDAITSAYGSQSTSQLDDIATKWTGLGWAAAGAWFNTVSRAQQSALNAAEAAIPVAKPPTVLWVDPSQNTVEGRTSEALHQFATWLDKGYSATGSAITADDYNKLGTDAGYGRKPITMGNNDLFNVVMRLIGGVADLYRLNPSDYSVLGVTSNPLAELAAFGHRNLIGAFKVLDVAVDWAGSLAAVKTFTGTIGQALSESPKAKAASSNTAFIASVFSTTLASEAGQIASVVMNIAGIFATLLFTTGLLCGYFVPLIPFAVFFFNVLAWIVSVFESVISMPLLALAHLTTKGEGLPGDMARQGYFFLFSIFLRPTLMVFGLIAGFLIFYVAISFLNATYSIAARGAMPLFAEGSGSTTDQMASAHGSATMNGYMTFAKVIFNVIYGIFCYICANSAFNTIKFFPEHAMRWMASQGVLTEKMGDKQLMSSAMTGITAYAFRDTIQKTVGDNPGTFMGISKLNAAAGGRGDLPSHAFDRSGGGGSSPTPQITPNAPLADVETDPIGYAQQAVAEQHAQENAQLSQMPGSFNQVTGGPAPNTAALGQSGSEPNQVRPPDAPAPALAGSVAQNTAQAQQIPPPKLETSQKGRPPADSTSNQENSKQMALPKGTFEAPDASG